MKEGEIDMKKTIKNILDNIYGLFWNAILVSVALFLILMVVPFGEARSNANKIIEECKDLSDLEKLEAYYNFIALNTDYDYEALEVLTKPNLEKCINRFKNANLLSHTRSLNGVFDSDENTKSICSSYANAFTYLCLRSKFKGDVKVYTVPGFVEGYEGFGHAWNVVKINNDYYHVDVTFGDYKRQDSIDFAKKYYFMQKIENKNHHVSPNGVEYTIFSIPSLAELIANLWNITVIGIYDTACTLYNEIGGNTDVFELFKPSK